MPATGKGKEKTANQAPQEAVQDINSATESKGKVKTIKLRAKRFMTWNMMGVKIVGEPARDENGKLITTPDGKKTVGKVIEIRSDFWPDPLAFDEAVKSLIDNEYFEIVH